MVCHSTKIHCEFIRKNCNHGTSCLAPFQSFIFLVFALDGWKDGWMDGWTDSLCSSTVCRVSALFGWMDEFVIIHRLHTLTTEALSDDNT